MNCEFAGYADRILQEKGVTCMPTYWSERDDWTLAMVAAGLGFAFMPENAAQHPGVVALPVTEPEFWRKVNLVTVRGRPYSPGVGALLREAMPAFLNAAGANVLDFCDTHVPKRWCLAVMTTSSAYPIPPCSRSLA